ncbi:N-acetylmuramoyl-L-alanine amidase [Puteibacter caeruleilacunae]|nr:N-acetylmuramoyl-L-alanine amidase [Puteibacter caeruleilacunae]
MKFNYTAQATKYSIQLFTIIAFLLIASSNGFSQTTSTTVAKKGEGIYTLLKRNGLSPSKYMNAFIDLNKTRLGKNNGLIVGRKYTLPKSTGSSNTTTTSTASKGTSIGSFPIFGPKHANIKRIDKKLSGAVYYLVSGHGGPDPGAVSKHGKYQLAEDEYAYDVMLRLAKSLMEHGATVYMITRDNNDGIRDNSFLKLDKDERCYPNLRIPYNQLSRLRQRTNAVNNLYLKNKGKKYQRVIITHVDSRTKRKNIDVFFYYDKRSKTGKKLASNLLNTFNRKYREHQPGRGYEGYISSRNLYVLKHTYPPATYIELGNINHSRDLQRIIKADNRQALAKWLAEGLMLDFQNNK